LEAPSRRQRAARLPCGAYLVRALAAGTIASDGESLGPILQRLPFLRFVAVVGSRAYSL